ncbi:MAG: polysaccharide biosynthesis/export family protein [Pseudomonadota bacterium]
MRSALIAVAVATLAVAPAAAQDATTDPLAEEIEALLPVPFTLRPGDLISVTVLEDPNLSRQLLVRPDNKVSMPIAGVIDVTDLKPEDLERIILRRLASDFITPPTVSVALTGLGAANQRFQAEGLLDEVETLEGRVYFIGEVNGRGSIGFNMEDGIDILQALSLAGGVTPFAATQRIQIRRRAETGEQIFLYDYELIEDGEFVEPLMLEDGDVIVVPQRGLFE